MRKITLIGCGVLAGLGVLLMLLLRGDSGLTRDSLRIGYAVEAPYAFVLANGTVTGESPEVAREIARRLGITKLSWRQVDFAALIAELEEDRIDVIAAGMFITPERAKRITFSEPSFHVLDALLVAKGNPQNITAYSDIVRNPAYKCAVLSGSIEEARLQHLNLPAARMLSVPDALTGRVALEAGLTQCLALSAPTLRWMALTDKLGKTEIVELPSKATMAKEYLGYGGFGFRQHDRDLLQAWNKEMRRFIGSPEHLRKIAEFGFSEQELPGNVTTQEVLGK